MNTKMKNLRSIGCLSFTFFFSSFHRKISRALSLHFRPSESLTEAWDWFTSSVSSVYHSVFTPKGRCLPSPFLLIRFPVHDSGGGNIAKLIYRDSTAHTNGGRPADEDDDVETGSGREETPKPVEPKQPPGRRKRRVSTMLLLSGGPLANHAALGVPEIKTQDSMSSVERVTPPPAPGHLFDSME